MKKRIFRVIPAALAGVTVLSLIVACAGLRGEVMRGALLVLLACFAAVTAVCVLLYGGRERSVLYKIGFALTHVGLIAFIAGNLLFACVGTILTVSVPVGGNTLYSSVRRESGDFVELGFGIAVKSFEIERYEDGGDKRYAAELILDDGGDVKNPVLEVNRPARIGGWKIYLMSYHGDGDAQYVDLALKKDPLEYCSAGGCVCVIAGAFLMCLFPKGKRHGGGGEPA